MTEMVTLNINIDKELRKDLKKIALDQEVTVTSIVTGLILDYVEEYKKKNKG